MNLTEDFIAIVVISGCCLAVICIWLAKYLPAQAQQSLAATNTQHTNISRLQPSQPQKPVTHLQVSQSQPKFNWFRFCMQMDTHLMLVGKTKAGKSMTAMALCIARSYVGKVIILDPHAKDTDWSGLQVVGAGRNYIEVGRAMLALMDEMDKRYNSPEYKAGKNIEPLTIFVDELPLLVKNIEHALTFLQVLAMEGRKVNMRLICLTQSYLVKTLKLEGQGDTRDNFIAIYLGKHARRLMPELGNVEWPAVMDNDGEWIPVKRTFIPRLVAGGFDLDGYRYQGVRPNSLWRVPTDYTVPASVPGSGSRFPAYSERKVIDFTEPEPGELSELETQAIIALHNGGFKRGEIAAVLKGRRQDRLKQIASVLDRIEGVSAS